MLKEEKRKKSVLRVFIARLNSGSWSLFPENEGKLYTAHAMNYKQTSLDEFLLLSLPICQVLLLCAF